MRAEDNSILESSLPAIFQGHLNGEDSVAQVVVIHGYWMVAKDH